MKGKCDHCALNCLYSRCFYANDDDAGWVINSVRSVLSSPTGKTAPGYLYNVHFISLSPERGKRQTTNDKRWERERLGVGKRIEITICDVQDSLTLIETVAAGTFQ